VKSPFQSSSENSDSDSSELITSSIVILSSTSLFSSSDNDSVSSSRSFVDGPPFFAFLLEVLVGPEALHSSFDDD